MVLEATGALVVIGSLMLEVIAGALLVVMSALLVVTEAGADDGTETETEVIWLGTSWNEDVESNWDEKDLDVVEGVNLLLLVMSATMLVDEGMLLETSSMLLAEDNAREVDDAEEDTDTDDTTVG